MTSRASLAELAAADIRLHPAEAVALVAALCRRQERGELRGVPPPGIIRLTRDGAVLVEGPVTTGDGVVPRMAQLLSDLLPGFDAPPEFHVSGGLRLVIARALGTLDLPAYDSIGAFADALDRFAASDLRASVRCLFHSWEERRQSAEPARGPLTISDVRRARRATGLTLEDIATVSHVPATQLRELEWGYFRHWPRTEEGRDRIARYARAAGLDEVVVFAIAWPLVEETAIACEPELVTMNGLVPIGSQAVAVAPRPAPPAPRQQWIPWVVGVAAIVLLTLSSFSLVREPAVQQASVASNSVSLEEQNLAPVAAAAPVPTRADAPASAAAAAARPRRATARPTASRPTASRPAAARPTAVRPASTSPAPARRPAPRSRSFLHKELFRIVFR